MGESKSRSIMDVKISPINFKGLWEPVKILKESNGYKPGIPEYTYYELYDMVYHPFKNETAEEIAKIVNKFFKGRTYNMVDRKYGSHKAGDYYQMNRVTVGEVIDEKDIQEYLAKGYTRKMKSGLSSEKAFWKAMENEAYAASAPMKLDVEWIKNIVARIFDKTAS